MDFNTPPNLLASDKQATVRTEVIAKPGWDDMVLEKSHQKAGVYYSIRQAYTRHASVAIVIMTTLTLFAIILPRVFPPSAIKLSQPRHTNGNNLFSVEEVSLKPALAYPAKR